MYPSSHTSMLQRIWITDFGKICLNLNSTFNEEKKKGGWGWGGEGQGDKITALKSVRHLKRFSTESRWNLWSSCFITHSDPCTAHTLLFTYSHMHSSQTGTTRTEYALQHIFLVYTLKYFNRNLLDPVIKKKKTNLHVLRDVSFFEL